MTLLDSRSQEGQESPTAYSTGDEGGDLIMQGGLPDQGLSLIIGPPGSGKTVLALQIAFVAARTGRNVVYLTSTSESHVRLLQHARQFTFFDERVIRKNFNLISINTHVQQQGVEATINYIVDVARSAKADLLIIDGFVGLKQLFQTQNVNLMYTLISRLNLFAFTTVLLGSYQADSNTEAEFAVADAIVELSHDLQNLQRQRFVSVLKIRGKACLEGLHSFAINQHGITMYPRQESLATAPLAARTNQRLFWGIPELDTMLGGGVFRGSTTMIKGGTGMGKTLLGLQFLLAGAPDEPGLFVSLQESTEDIARYLHDTGGTPQQIANIRVIHMSPTEINLDVLAWRIRKHVVEAGTRRIVLDTFDAITDSFHQRHRLSGFIASLNTSLRSYNITTIFIRETPWMLWGQTTLPNDDQQGVVDTMLFIFNVVLAATLQRVIAVVKHRGSEHQGTLRKLDVVDGQIVIGAPLRQFAQILSGSPMQSEPSVEGEANHE